MITAPFDYEAPESLEEAIRLLHENGEDAKLLAGGHSLLPLMKVRLAAPTVLVDLRRSRPARHPAGERRLADRPMTRHADLQDTPELGVVARGVADRGPAGAQPRHDRRLARARRPGVGPARGGARAGRRGDARGPNGERTIAAADLFQDYLTTALAHDEVITEVRCRPRGLRLRLPEVHPPRRGLGDGRRVRLVKKGGGRHVRRRADRADQHGRHAAAGHAAEDALRGGQLDEQPIAAAPSRPRRAPTRPAT